MLPKEYDASSRIDIDRQRAPSVPRLRDPTGRTSGGHSRLRYSRICRSPRRIAQLWLERKSESRERMRRGGSASTTSSPKLTLLGQVRLTSSSFLLPRGRSLVT